MIKPLKITDLANPEIRMKYALKAMEFFSLFMTDEEIVEALK